MVVPFDQLPSEARLWVFAADRPLGADESAALLSAVDDFLGQWKAHGHPLTVARDWKYDRFLLVGVDEASAGASGCSIDAMVRTLEQLERALTVTLLDHGPVLFRQDQRHRAPVAAGLRGAGTRRRRLGRDGRVRQHGHARRGFARWPVGNARARLVARASVRPELRTTGSTTGPRPSRCRPSDSPGRCRVLPGRSPGPPRR